VLDIPRRIMVRRLALIVIPIAVLAVGGTAFARGHSASPAATNVVTPFKVTVTAIDYSFKLSTKTVPRGRTIAFTVINRGRTVHDFAFPSRKKTPLLAAGKRTTLKITFTKKGRFQYICTVPRHAQLGMIGFLTVK
jgi:uncharacterized cupredoxin-like copper-binding protein